ncbi:hypothetical protein phytr_9010 [Candidatus Phycorickettsia trachydisci]|uniref:Uncharacterized protein n=1 Tax=Candidatus Phycorickettsia trachydisci TaxID=2115978 RepID=A0A2P1P987_9RICK|nr:hypothetical protein [Candidatus Phycorickettsia trachydisci]AVP87831.1 hypothetical protein phytr_9010 [Candidatus Phycorickettsia trachydisci]
MFSCFQSQEERQAKLLARSIKKAYETKKCWNNPLKARELAYELAKDPNISTKYVPVRDVIKIFQNGDLNLAVHLFDGNRKDPIIHRAKNLISVMFSICNGEDENFYHVADTMNWLKILMLLTVVKLIHINSGIIAAKNYLYQEIGVSDNINDKDLVEIPKIMKFIAISELESTVDVKAILPYFLKIFKPISTNPCDHISFNVDELAQRFPIDIIKDSSDNLSVYKTLGINERVDPALMEIAFKNRVELTAQTHEIDNNISHSQIRNPDDLFEGDLKYYLAFKKVWKLRAEGFRLDSIVEQVCKEEGILTEKSIKLAYLMHRQSSVIPEIEGGNEQIDEFDDTMGYRSYLGDNHIVEICN